MKGRRGTAVVVDVRTDRILASYHPAVAARRVVHPGSSLKPFTLLTLLRSGKVDAHTSLICKRPLTIAGHRLDCPHPATQQPFDPAMALAYSCNFYFTSVATRLSPAELREGLVRAGFGETTGLFANEAAGEVALAGSTEQLQLQAIGEWGVSVTPLELLHGYRDLAVLSQKNDVRLVPLFEGLQQSVAYGMGHRAQPAGAMAVAGKTGTAPADEGRWTHAWFAGYAPVAKPEIALVVFLEKGHGGTDAAEAAREIFTAFGQAKAAQAHLASYGVRP